MLMSDGRSPTDLESLVESSRSKSNGSHVEVKVGLTERVITAVYLGDTELLPPSSMPDYLEYSNTNPMSMQRRAKRHTFDHI
jgi:hypothetical protein